MSSCPIPIGSKKVIRVWTNLNTVGKECNLQSQANSCIFIKAPLQSRARLCLSEV